MSPAPSLLALTLAFAAAPLAAACLPAPAGLVAWYPAERHADDAAGFHHGSFVATPTYANGQVGEAFRFDGIADGVLTDTTGPEQRAVNDDFTIALWARPEATLAGCAESTSGTCPTLPWATFPAHGDNTAGNPAFGATAGIGLAIGTNGVCVGQHATFLVSCLAVASMSIDDWVHVVAVVEDRRARIYLDGELVRTGLRSERESVFASWEVLGSGLSLGRYDGDLDEIAIFDRVLDEAEIEALFLAGSDGLCRRECNESDADGFQGATVLGTSPLRSIAPDGIFGGDGNLPEPSSLLFADNEADGTVHAIEWRTVRPVQLESLGLHAFHDQPTQTQRAFRHVRIEARLPGQPFTTIYDRDVTVPYAPGGRELHHCARVRPGLYGEFRAEFTQDGPPTFSGPRIVELDGFGIGVFRDGFEPVAD